MKTLMSIVLTLAIVVNVVVVASAQFSNVEPVQAVAKDAIRWSERYKSVYPNEAFGNVYGRLTVEQMLKMEGMEKVFVFSGLAEDGTIKLVFKGSNKEEEVLNNGIAYDRSMTCPPFCQGDGIRSTGSQIDEGYAQQMIVNFQNRYRSRAKAQLFDKESFAQVLAQEKAEGIYFINAINDNDQQTLVLAGIDIQGNVMWDGVVIIDGKTIPAFQPMAYPAQGIVAKK